VKKWMAVILLALMVAAVGCGGGDQQVAEDAIKIGIQGPMSGPMALEGQGFLKAAQLLADQINEQGGLLGREIVIVPGDDKSDPKESALVAQKMISSNVVAVIGSYSSTATEPAANIYHEAGILHITPSSTATPLSEKGFERFFRTCFLDDRQGLFAAQFAVDTLGLSKVALIHDNTTYAKGLADWTRIYLEENGATVVYYDAITPGEKDFSPVLTNVKGVAPELIYFTGYFSDGGLLVRQARELGIECLIMGGNAMNNSDLVKNAGLQYAQGVLVTTEPVPTDLPYAEAQQFIADFEAAYGTPPQSIWTLSGADALRVVVEAIAQTGSDDPAVLAEYLHNEMGDFPGITGPITFDEKGDRLGTIHKAYEVDAEGNFVPYEG
jgi:branched-chain amino acid transport system substrate-binding protein